MEKRVWLHEDEQVHEGEAGDEECRRIDDICVHIRRSGAAGALCVKFGRTLDNSLGTFGQN